MEVNPKCQDCKHFRETKLEYRNCEVCEELHSEKEETTYEAYIPGTSMTPTFTLPAYATIYEKKYEAHEALRRKYMSNVHFRKRNCCFMIKNTERKIR